MTGSNYPPVKLGLVGCGGMSGAHMRGYTELSAHGINNFECLATCDVNEDAASVRADEFATLQDGRRPQVYTSVDEMLAGEPDLEAVDICATHRVHHVLAVAALEAGKHVVIEKPLGITMKACMLILEAAKRNDRILCVAENYRRTPTQRAVKWALDKGIIGAPRCLVFSHYGEGRAPWSWRDSKRQAGAGWLFDGGVHYTDMFRYHLGEAKDVYAEVRTFEPYRYPEEGAPFRVTVEDSCFAVVTFESGAVVQWTSVRSAPGQPLDQELVYGDEGSLDYAGNLTLRGQEPVSILDDYDRSLSSEERERLFPSGVTDTVATELWEFGMSIRDDGYRPETDGVEGMKAVAICMGVLESGWTRERVDLRQIETCRINGYQADLDRELDIHDTRWNVWAAF